MIQMCELRIKTPATLVASVKKLGTVNNGGAAVISSAAKVSRNLNLQYDTFKVAGSSSSGNVGGVSSAVKKNVVVVVSRKSNKGVVLQQHDAKKLCVLLKKKKVDNAIDERNRVRRERSSLVVVKKQVNAMIKDSMVMVSGKCAVKNNKPVDALVNVKNEPCNQQAHIGMIICIISNFMVRYKLCE